MSLPKITGSLAMAGLVLIIVGAVFWAKSVSDKTFGCQLNKETSVTDPIKEETYNRCVKSANTALQWSPIVTFTGVGTFVVGLLGVIAIYIRGQGGLRAFF